MNTNKKPNYTNSVNSVGLTPDVSNTNNSSISNNNKGSNNNKKGKMINNK